MLIWAVVNAVLSVLALGFALLNKSAPHRLRFHVCFIALLCWLMPWAQVPGSGWLPNLLSLDLWSVEKRLISQTAAITQIPIIVDTRNVPLANDVMLLNVPLIGFSALFLIGLTLFAWNLLRHQLRLAMLQRSARNGSGYWRQCGIESSVPILLQDQINGAFFSGVFKPVIWVHDNLAKSDELPTLLRHELTHIEQHDNWYLLAITLVEKLFWWNPLAWYLSRQTRELQELSCDERCRASNADYAAELAALMLNNLGIPRSEAQEPLLLSANIFNKPNLDIQRLKVLQRTYQMKPRHIVSAVATAVLAVTAVGLVTAQPASDKVANERQVFFINGPEGAGEAPGFAVGAAQGSNVHVWQHTTNGQPDQFIRMERSNGNASLTFNFTDVALPVALVPLVNMLGGQGQLQAMAIANGAGAPGTRTFAFRSTGPNDAESPQVQGLTQEVPAEQKAALEKLLRTEAEKLLNTEAEKLLKTELEKLGPGAEIKTVKRVGGMPVFGTPVSNKLVLEDASARTRQVTVSGENLSLEAAIAKIADASGCNIFKDKDTIVVDYCKPQ